MRERLALWCIGIVAAVVLATVAFLLLRRPTAVEAGSVVSVLPTFNAFLNGTTAVLLSVGYLFIRQKRVTAHKACMLTAFGVSSLFLISYVIYHSQAGSTPFTATGFVRPIYFVLLISHVTLAACILPLSMLTIYRAWTGQFQRHRRVARWTLPLWIYVSVTGVIVYLMLYHLSSSV